MRTVLWIVATVLFVLVVASGMALAQGSLELFPTDGQQDEVRTVYATAFVFSLLCEMAIAGWLWVTRRKD